MALLLPCVVQLPGQRIEETHHRLAPRDQLRVHAAADKAVGEDLQPDLAHVQIPEGEVHEGPDGVLAESLRPVLAAERDPDLA